MLLLAKELYQSCTSLKVKGEVKDQLHRAALSIVLNLAEGSGKLSKKEQARFYQISLGSLREVQALLELFGDQNLNRLADQLGANLWCLFRALK